jgi:putative ATP-binding cassette transporter
MICGLNDEIRLGERILISGNAFIAARLFKAIAGLWPWGRGSIDLPDNELMFFMPPRPFLPDGVLRHAICYPSQPEAFGGFVLEELLELAGLDQLKTELDKNDAWEKVLTRDQQQRLGLVRLLLYRPKWILLQEAFDSLDPEGEVMMLTLICQHLPEAALLTISSQPTAEPFHNRHINL